MFYLVAVLQMVVNSSLLLVTTCSRIKSILVWRILLYPSKAMITWFTLRKMASTQWFVMQIVCSLYINGSLVIISLFSVQLQKYRSTVRGASRSKLTVENQLTEAISSLNEFMHQQLITFLAPPQPRHQTLLNHFAIGRGGPSGQFRIFNFIAVVDMLKLVELIPQKSYQRLRSRWRPRGLGADAVHASQ